MKRTFIILFFLISAVTISAQRSVDRLFEKYSGNEGFMTLTIDGDILKIVRCFSDGEKETCLPSKITQIRILAQENEKIVADNFYKTIMKEIDNSDYEEFMRVKESHQDMIMLVKSEGRHFREFLLIAGGVDDNVVIQIKGDMTFDEAKRFSGQMKKDCSTTHITGRISL